MGAQSGIGGIWDVAGMLEGSRIDDLPPYI